MQSNVASGSKKRQGDLAIHSTKSLSLSSTGGPAKKQNTCLGTSPSTTGKLDSLSSENISKMETNEMLLLPSTGKNVKSFGSHDKKDMNNLPQNSSTVLTRNKTSAISKSAKLISSIKERNISQENSAIPIKEGTSLVSRGKPSNIKEKSKDLKSKEMEHRKLSRSEQLSITDFYVKQDKPNSSSSAPQQHSNSCLYSGQSLPGVMPPLPSFQPSLSSQLSGGVKTLQGESCQKSQPSSDGTGVVVKGHLTIGGTGEQVQKPTYATVADRNKFSLPLNMSNDQRLSPEHGIYLTRISDASLSDYADAITAAIGESGLCI